MREPHFERKERFVDLYGEKKCAVQIGTMSMSHFKCLKTTVRTWTREEIYMKRGVLSQKRQAKRKENALLIDADEQ